jgi:hypothetical protein
MQTRIMHIEDKSRRLTGPARIGRASFSKTGRSVYYGGRSFPSLKARASSPTNVRSPRTTRRRIAVWCPECIGHPAVRRTPVVYRRRVPHSESPRLAGPDNDDAPSGLIGYLEGVVVLAVGIGINKALGVWAWHSPTEVLESLGVVAGVGAVWALTKRAARSSHGGPSRND